MPSRRSTSSKSCGACATTPSASIDALALPTMPTAYTIAQVLGRSDRAQQPARHLHQLRQPARPLRARRAGVDARDGTPFGITLLAPAGNDAALASLGRVFHADTGLPLGATGTAQPPLAPLPGAAGRRRDRHRGRRRASLRHAAQRRAQVLRRAASWNGPRRPRTIACSCCRARRRRSPGCCGSAPMPACAIDVEIWAMPAEQFGRFVASIPAAAVDRHADPRRRPRCEGLSGRGRGDARRPRHLRLRRLAQLHGADESQRVSRARLRPTAASPRDIPRPRPGSRWSRRECRPRRHPSSCLPVPAPSRTRPCWTASRAHRAANASCGS